MDRRSTIRILLVDDHLMFLEGLARALEQERDLRIVGQYPLDESALQVVNKSGATIILIGINGETECAVDFVRKAHGRGFDGKILVVASGVSGPEGVHLVQAGVAGILDKSNSIEFLCNTMRQIARGEVYVEKRVLTSLLRSMNEKPLHSWPKLSDRERSILRLLCDGLANRQIAHQLEVSEGSVKASIQQLFAKLAVRTRSQLVRVSLEQYDD